MVKAFEKLISRTCDRQYGARRGRSPGLSGTEQR